MQAQRVKSIKKLGIQNTLDFEVNHLDHNFYAEGVVVSNSHAISYASMCAATVYYKFKYPLEFYCCLLNLTKEEPNPIEEISKIQQELIQFGIELQAPSLIYSENNFSIKNNKIYFGLSSIKGISEKAIIKLEKYKHKHSSKFDIFYAANECRIPLNVQAALILCGSMDDMITDTRSKIFLEACLWNLLTDREKVKVLEIGKDFNFDLIKSVKALNKDIKNEKGKPIIKDSRMETLRRDFQPYYDLYQNNKKIESFSQWFYEKQLLGFAYSSTLIDIFKKEAADLIPISQIQTELDGYYVHFVGEVIDCKKWKSKEKKTPSFKMTIRDHTSSIDALMFDSAKFANIELCKENNGRLPQEGDIVVCRGKKAKTAVFLNNCSIQENKVFMKISEVSGKKTSEKFDVSTEKG